MIATATTPREAAVKRLQQKRSFLNHATAYVLVNILLIVTWAVDGRDDFWPFWTIFGWGIGLVLHAWNTYFQSPITEDQIERELARS